MSRFAVAGLQLALNNQNNLDELVHEVMLAKKRFPWLHMVVIGELALFGPSTEQAVTADHPVFEQLAECARENNVWLVPGSLFVADGRQVYNTTPVFDPQGQQVASYRKIFPFAPYEKGVTPGAECCVFDVPGVGRFGVSICYDMWFPEVSRTLAWMGAEVILHPTMTNTIDREVEISLARANALSNQVYFVDINVAGRLGNGRSVVCGPGGEVVHQAGEVREVIAVELDLAHVRRCRERGWHGLGQVLKSWRDCDVQFPAYQQGAHASPALQQLGELILPEQDS
ncbi:carbon-nitrogen hydrolase family protein [Simiduia aestuariiviva]|uniref:Putative amidohydrolase n=1 Tax=Simiduia aestuariiviva TaxID=1510459 RepID=A0A839ULV3_9GAMM|nr:carbon-nitrogen hydrolase family protein [Simiduia aestuariiviva]MBB3167751.1 putative amidohydrolase [Simiduia aestuariiviva]